jgi:hypothetical protein
VAGREALVVAVRAAVLGDPRERALHDSPAGQHLERVPVAPGTICSVIFRASGTGTQLCAEEPVLTMWLWHAEPGPLSPDELWRAYLVHFDE